MRKSEGQRKGRGREKRKGEKVREAQLWELNQETQVK